MEAWMLCVLAGLLAGSGFFNAAEAALFGLTQRQRREAAPIVQRLLSEPRALLFTILLGNLVVNVLFFAFAARLEPEGERWGGLVVGLIALFVLLALGEILPKLIGLRARQGFAGFAASFLRPLVGLVGALAGPIVRLLEVFDHLISRWVPRDAGLTAEGLAAVLERGAEEGELHQVEADLLYEVVRLEDIRVREIMTPRVDALFLDVTGRDRARVVERALERRHGWLPVVDGDPDRVVGRVAVRTLLRRAADPVRRLMVPIAFVPEVASALDCLRTLRGQGMDEAVVIDEWGGTAGTVSAEDVFAQLVGEDFGEDAARPSAVLALGGGRFRVAGGLSIRDWNEQFGQSVVPTEFETVGGFVAAVLGRIPRAGDVARVGELVLQVHEVRARRVLTVDIGLAPAQAAAGGGA
jgi:putative hemolysin